MSFLCDLSPLGSFRKSRTTVVPNVFSLTKVPLSSHPCGWMITKEPKKSLDGKRCQLGHHWGTRSRVNCVFVRLWGSAPYWTTSIHRLDPKLGCRLSEILDPKILKKNWLYLLPYRLLSYPSGDEGPVRTLTGPSTAGTPVLVQPPTSKTLVTRRQSWGGVLPKSMRALELVT